MLVNTTDSEASLFEFEFPILCYQLCDVNQVT